MKKTLQLLIFLLFASFTLSAQTEKLWKELPSKVDVVKHKSVTRADFPSEFKLFQLNLEAMKQVLYPAPDRMNIGESGIVIVVPNSNGKLERFEMFEASNFDAVLQAQYPNIRAYAGKGLDDKTAQIRLSFGVNSLQTMIFRADKATEFMEPYSQDTTIFAVYSRSNVTKRTPFTCLTTDEQQIANLGRNGNVVLTSDPNLRTFRLALSCVAEYSNYFGATDASNVGLVLTAFNNTMSRVNGVNNRDFAIHMNIVASSTNVIYYDPSTDPYDDGAVGSGGTWNAQLQNTLSQNLTGAATTLAANNAAYDIGHLFGASGGGGNAGCIGCICVNDTADLTDQNKGSGYTSPGDGNPSGDSFDIDYVAHEIGHQLGANHTFTHSNENNSVNYEPGSGSTIMAYAGITSKDVQNNSDDYFHAGSISQVQVNMSSKTCDVETALTHSVPVVAAGADFTIPRSTPFTLTGSATDAGGIGALTYCWEQYDDAAGAASLCGISNANPTGDTDCEPIGTKTVGPVFRSYPPTASGSRTFPRLQSVLDGSVSTAGSEIAVEFLPSVARALNFRLTARDNSLVGGGGLTNFDDVVVTVAAKNALTVSYPATANTSIFAVGSTQTVTWAGATGTAGHQTIAGAATVDILFSNDGGLTFPYTLLAATTNDGSQAVTLPAGVSGADCRFKVKASGNIFFNISKSFAVGDYTYQLQNVCTDYVLNLDRDIPEDSGSFVGYGISVPEAFTLSDANIRVELTHGDIGSVFLAVRPAHLATGVTQFFNGSCDGLANMNLNFDTSGSVLNCAASTSGLNTVPPVAASVTAINAFNGNSATGTWFIFYTDIAVGDGITGTIQKVTFNLCRTVPVAVLASESFGLADFVLYPNPNNGNFNVQFTSTSSNEIQVFVHDLRGREIFTNKYNNSGLFNENLQLNNIQSGVYLVTVQDGARKEVKKIVVQ